MKKFLLRQFLPLFIAPAAILLSLTSMPDHANFSGDWKLNEGKSDLGNFGRFAATAVKVDQKADAITIAKTSPGFNGGDPTTTTMTVTFDGKEAESTVFGGAKRKTTAKWSDDGQSLVLNHTTTFERDGQTSEFKGVETWTLKDGALSIVTVSNSPRGETTTKAIYEK